MRARPRITALALVLSLASVASLAPRARADERPTLRESLTGEAKSAYEAARLLFDDGEFAGAETKYKVALEGSHDPRLYWNVAACEKQLRHYARAAALIDRFVKEAVSLVDPETMTQAESTLNALHQFVSSLQLRVQPLGSRVTIDGEDVGKSPLSRPIQLDLGKHTIRVEHEGYLPQEKTIEATGGGEQSLALTLPLAPIEAKLTVVSPEGDTLSIDDFVVGSGHWEGPVLPGEHQLHVTAEGKKAYDSTVRVAQGEHRTIEVTLEGEKKGPFPWAWVLGGAGVAIAGGVVGGYFLFKTQVTDEPPPAGKLGSVYIQSARARR